VTSLARPGAGTAARARARLNAVDRAGNRILYGLCAVGALLVFVAMVEVAYQVINNASASIDQNGLGFLGHTTWKPNFKVFGAGAFIYGTLMTSVASLVLATVIGVSIGLYLSMLAPKGVAAVVGPLVEMLAAIPSVILGLFGIVVIIPFVQGTLEPPLHTVLGFIPLFGPQETTGNGIFTASLVLTIMVVPIIAALSRDLFLTVPRELKEGAEALGSTRWEVIRGVVLPTTTSGIIAACVLGFGRALGEAIAVSQVVGGLSEVHSSLFSSGDTLASRIASQFPSPDNPLHLSALFYCALILLVLGIATNLLARRIAHGFRVKTA
jgi:phosphate transport system permease protein